MRASLLALVLLAPAALAQDAPELAPALQPFAGLLGDWAGPATQQTPSGPVEVLQTETVRVGLDGAIMTVEGLGRRVDEGEPGEVAFHAFGVFSADAETGEVWLDTWTREGRHVRVQPVPVEGGFDWGFDVSEGGPRVDYQMRFDEAGRWTETGRVTLPGGRVMDIFEMALDRVEAAE